MAEVFLTKEGYKEKEARLEYLKSEKRQEVIEKLKTAREFGDLSENAEYDAARNAQAENEARIVKLRSDIENAEVYDESKAVHGVIDIGSTVKVYDETDKEEIIFRIVGSNEADAINGKISDQSPVGAALIGHRKGDEVKGVVEASGYRFTYRVLDVTRD